MHLIVPAFTSGKDHGMVLPLHLAVINFHYTENVNHECQIFCLVCDQFKHTGVTFLKQVMKGELLPPSHEHFSRKKSMCLLPYCILKLEICPFTRDMCLPESRRNFLYPNPIAYYHCTHVLVLLTKTSCHIATQISLVFYFYFLQQ
jgi:hypothetical protein